MASKKAGRLAGLAALGLAAYMNKDKLFGAKGETKAAETKAETKAFDRDTDTGVDAQAGFNMGASAGKKIGKEMLARGEAEGKKIDNNDRFAGPATTKDTKFGDLEGAMKAQANAPTTPLTFGQTFRQARNAGNKAFAFNGKKYTTELAKPAAPAAVETNKRGGVGDGGQSMVERQNAGAKRAGLSVDDYITSGKKTIDEQDGTFKRGGKVKKMASGGVTSSASKRADGIATKGKTRGRVC